MAWPANGNSSLGKGNMVKAFLWLWTSLQFTLILFCHNFFPSPVSLLSDLGKMSTWLLCKLSSLAVHLAYKAWREGEYGIHLVKHQESKLIFIGCCGWWNAHCQGCHAWAMHAVRGRLIVQGCNWPWHAHGYRQFAILDEGFMTDSVWALRSPGSGCMLVTRSGQSAGQSVGQSIGQSIDSSDLDTWDGDILCCQLDQWVSGGMSKIGVKPHWDFLEWYKWVPGSYLNLTGGKGNKIAIDTLPWYTNRRKEHYCLCQELFEGHSKLLWFVDHMRWQMIMQTVYLHKLICIVYTYSIVQNNYLSSTRTSDNLVHSPPPSDA